MKALKEILLAVVLAIVMLLLLGLFYPVEPEIQILDREVVKRDTILVVDYIDKDPVYIEKEIIVHDTVYVNTSGDSVKTEVARLDTTFEDSARLEIAYYLAPRIYDVIYYAPPIESKTVTVNTTEYVYVDSSATELWDRAKYGYVAGVVSTALLVYLVK